LNKALNVSFTPRAKRQAARANVWWRQNRTAVPTAFSDELERVLELIATQPSIGARALNIRLPYVRRVLMHRVDHYLYYRVVEQPERMLQVLAVWHTSRGAAPL
jgi:plasmid stabilization system protein ParE